MRNAINAFCVIILAASIIASFNLSSYSDLTVMLSGAAFGLVAAVQAALITFMLER